jgi:hypothetical protein
MSFKPFPALLMLAASLLCAAPASAGDFYFSGNPFGTHGSGVIKTEQRQPGSFNMILSKGSIDFDVSVGPQITVAVEADDNLLPLITTEVKSGALVIDTKGNWTSSHNPKVYITVPSLGAVEVDGSGDAAVHGMAGGALGIRVRGSGDVAANGSAAQLDVLIEGSGDVDCRGLQADNAVVHIDGSGDAKVSVAKMLKVTINGSGDVSYSGEAQVVSSIHGSGDLIKQ